MDKVLIFAGGVAVGIVCAVILYQDYEDCENNQIDDTDDKKLLQTDESDSEEDIAFSR